MWSGKHVKKLRRCRETGSVLERVLRKCSVVSSVSAEEQAATAATRKCDTH
jgi:hypothetical protein